MDASRVEHFMKLSLKALKLDYVDLYLMHGPIGVKYVDDNTVFPIEGDTIAYDMSTDLVSIWKSMEAQVTAGRAKTIGVSNFGVAQIERVVNASKIKPSNLQVEAHVWFQQKKLREACKKHGMTFTAYAPLGSPGRAASPIASKGL
jgi:aldehyde reductase